MKKKALLTVTFILITGLSTAVVGGPNASEGEYVIMDSSSSASGTSAVGPNGTVYSTTFSVVNGSTTADQTGVINSSFENNTVHFTGVYQTPTPCYDLSHSVEKSGESYVFQVTAEAENGTCTQVIAYHKYKASFEAGEPYELTVKHGNESVNTLTHPDYSSDSSDTDHSDEDTGGVRGPIASFFHFLSNLF
ncbi:hypothetical protein GKQ38_02095 [Candidatus Nanohaloarchaea archaeon]|nr:hypothetical protein GKQ38_02095 [Candidatus Nanohaloarchaea archaeon]